MPAPPAALLLAALAAATPAWAPLRLASGEGDVPVRVALQVRTREAPDAPPVALAWASTARGSALGAVRGAGWSARVEVGPPVQGGWPVEVALRWEGPALLESAALRLSWPGEARVLGTDLGWATPERPRRVGRGTPILAEAGGLVVQGGEGFEAARLDAAEGRLEATLYLDDARDRPFATYPACLDQLPEPAEPGGAVQFAGLERRTRVLDVARRTGDVDRARAVLRATAAGTAFLPVVVERWPRGARAAVVFTDHADRSDAPALRALLWGTSDPSAEGRAGSGFLGRGLRLTKSFFVSGPPGSLTDPAVPPLAAALVAAGSEVALHSITPGRDDRAAVVRGLALAAPWRPVTWIDHEPYTNCEAVSSEGWRTEGPYGIRDLLVDAGIRWVWSAGDVAGFSPDARRGVLPDLFGDGEGPPPIYPLPADPRIWAFESSFFFASPALLAAALSDEALASLEARRGLFVGHTYLAAGPARTRQAGHLARLAVLREGNDLVLDPGLDAALGRVAARAEAGTLASLAWAEAGDRLRALASIDVEYLPDGSARVENGAEVALQGLTLALPEEGLEVSADGLPLPHADAPGATRVFLDLPAGGAVRLRAHRGPDPVPFLVPP